MKNGIKYLVIASRIIIGLVFIFSSFVKGVDPLGTAYKIEEYMRVFGFAWAVPFAFVLSVFLCTAEFVTGVLILTNTCKKLGRWLLLLMMTFFLVTTFIDAVTNQVTDCGCFGDAIKLTNWQTFWKNVPLMILTLIIFFGGKEEKKRKQSGTSAKDIVVLLVAIAMMVGFCLYNYYNEPILDFRPWKVGNQMIPKASERGEIQSFLKYKNKETGEEKEFPSAELMKYYEQDSTWGDKWEFLDSKVIDPNEITALGFSMLDEEGTDHAKSIIGSEAFVFIVTSYDLKEASNEGLKQMEKFAQKAMENGIDLVVLTASLPEEIDSLRKVEKGFENIQFYLADDKAIKTVMRSNPGLVLLHNGMVIGKWHYRNIPEFNMENFLGFVKKYKAE